MTAATVVDAFRRAYAEHRAQEGRGHAGTDLLSLPYLSGGPLARQWRVRARTFDAFVKHLVRPAARGAGHALRIADLGAGNGWLSYRLAREGHDCTAIDIRDDAVDGLGAARGYLASVHFDRVVAPFDDLPCGDGAFDLAVFNASIHYATDLVATLAEAARVVRPGGSIAILDSPFYATAEDGAAMVAEKHRAASAQFGDRADALLALPFIEFLTASQLEAVSRPLGLTWRRRRVRYPLWYEWRPIKAALQRRRAPSRFDVWVADKP